MVVFLERISKRSDTLCKDLLPSVILRFLKVKMSECSTHTIYTRLVVRIDIIIIRYHVDRAGKASIMRSQISSAVTRTILEWCKARKILEVCVLRCEINNYRRCV